MFVCAYVSKCSVCVCNWVDRAGSRPLPSCLYASVVQPFPLYYFQAAFDESELDMSASLSVLSVCLSACLSVGTPQFTLLLSSLLSALTDFSTRTVEMTTIAPNS